MLEMKNWVAGLIFGWIAVCGAHAQMSDLPVHKLQMPPGFKVEVWARVPNARQLSLGNVEVVNGVLQSGSVYVGSMKGGTVSAVRFGTGVQVTQVQELARGLRMPVGVAYRNGSLFVSAVQRIVRLDGVDDVRKDKVDPVVVVDDLPTEAHHGWKFIAFGPDGKLYAPVGAPCNICEPDPQRYANILRMNADGSAREVFAQGVRNTVGFDWSPLSKTLWFTDNGRDMLGDDLPPDELNHAPKAGLHFGYPYCHGGDLQDPEFGSKRACKEFVAPVQKLGAHVAALGMRFYTGTMFPAAYRNQIFIAEHGSWNRSKKSGYRITQVTLEGDKAVSYTPFISGWQEGEKTWGRPVDVLVLPDGSMLVSDDFADAIYRVTWVVP
jgi:glucose/arabinose dehydrogenase